MSRYVREMLLRLLLPRVHINMFCVLLDALVMRLDKVPLHPTILNTFTFGIVGFVMYHIFYVSTERVFSVDHTTGGEGEQGAQGRQG